jgi:hypothetical protein
MKNHLSSWVDHIKEYATNNGKKYSECLKDPKCREMYHSKKGSAKVPQPEGEIDLTSINLKSNGKRKSKRS